MAENVVSVKVEVQNHKIEQDNNVHQPLLWKGRHLFLKTNPITLWITRVASAIIMAAGIALIAALTGATALAIGISLTVLGLAALIYSIGMPMLREDFLAHEHLPQLKKKLQCAKDWNDLPKVAWNKKAAQIRIFLKQDHLAPNVKGLVGELGNKKIAFIISIIRNEGNIERIDLFSLGRQFQNKQMIIEYNGQEISLHNEAIKIPFFSNTFKDF